VEIRFYIGSSIMK